MSDTISLRVFGFVDNDALRLICLDTNIAVSANSIPEAQQKMIDALLSYFGTFSKEEMENRAYIRRARFSYRLLWHILPIMGSILHFFHTIANYDPLTNHLKLA